MTARALGLIEVRGYLGAVVAADTALKAANVTLLNIETVKAGLNTVQLVGDVSAVRAAVDAALDVVQDKPYYLTSHVISRLDDQTRQLFSSRQDVGKTDVELVPKEPVLSSSTELELPVGQAFSKYRQEELERLKVVKLRSMAYKEKKIGLSKKEIKFGNKRLLVEALMKIDRKES